MSENPNTQPGDAAQGSPSMPETPAAAEATPPAEPASSPEAAAWTEPDTGAPAWAGDSGHDHGAVAGIAETFLPGVEAASVIALVLSALAAGAYLLVYPLVQLHGAAVTWSNFKKHLPQSQEDPFATQRDWVDYQGWTHIILGLVAILVALLVLGLWTAGRNKLWSRSVAQAALVVGLAVVVYGILMKTGAIGSGLPSVKEIQKSIASSQ